MRVRRRRIQLLVADLLTKYAITEPPVPVELVAQREGLVIRLQALDSSLSGFLLRQPGGAIIGVNSFHPRVRQRFTIAHEIGHFLLHEDEGLHLDRAAHFRLRSDLASQGTDSAEIEANGFAAEILIPGSILQREMLRAEALDVLDDDFLMKLGRRFGVSTQAMMLRLTNLGYVDQ